MNAVEAARLTVRAAGRGLRAWWAWRRLVGAGNGGDAVASDAVWSLWLAEPRDMWWEALSRWQQPSTRPHDRELSLVALGDGSIGERPYPTALVEAAARHGHPIAETARARILAADDQGLVDAVCTAALDETTGDLLEFCAENGLLPSQPADRAAFFLLTGQHDRYRATDPDGSILALAYDGAPEGRRGRIQRMAVDAGDMALVRVLTATGPGGRVSRMTTDDVHYLTGRLAAGQEWYELWRIAQQLRLLDAVDAVGLIGASGDGRRWRPTDDADRALFDLLTRADADELRRAGHALTAPETVRLQTEGRVVGGKFSADGRCLAVVTESVRPASGLRRTISLFELPSGRLVQRYDGIDDVGSLHLLHQGDAIVTARWWPPLRTAGGGVIERYVDGRVETLYEDRVERWLVAAHLGGFVAVERGKHHPQLRFFIPEGHTVTRHVASLRAIHPWTKQVFRPPTRIWELPGGPLVLGGMNWLLVLDARPGHRVRLLGHARATGQVTGVCAPDPDHLVTTGPDGVRRWRLPGGRLVLEAGPRNLGYEPREPVVLGRRGQVAVTAVGTTKLLDAVSLVEAPDRWSRYTHCDQLWSSPSGGCHALVRSRFVDVVVGVHSDAVVALADRPLADVTPADLARLGEELRTDLPGLPARPFLELLHSCLEHRFAAEVALGGAVLVAGEHDIALGGGRR